MVFRRSQKNRLFFSLKKDEKRVKMAESPVIVWCRRSRYFLKFGVYLECIWRKKEVISSFPKNKGCSVGKGLL